MSIIQYGEESTVGTPMGQLRRTELHKIAKAHGIRVKPDCIKRKILPLIEEAVEEGIIDPTNVLKGAKFPHFITGEQLASPEITPGKMLVDKDNKIHVLSDEPCVTIHLGNAKKWCVMQGSTILHEGLVTKEEADGLHVPTGG